MKIEQRCGRADRIGQKRDVHIYNLIVEDTVENRVREVLEQKLSVILQEMGVDKYSDVLDSEVAEYDFTDVYMSAVRNPKAIDRALQPVETEVKQQLANARQFKDVIHEEKDLSELVGQESNFDVEQALRTLLAYYDSWQGIPLTLIDRISVTDERVTEHLSKDVIQDKFSPMLAVSIKDFPNEAGYFMLWDISLTDKDNSHKIIPVFINERGILRPVAGKRIFDVLLNDRSRLTVREVPNIDAELYTRLERMSMDHAFDTFSELKDKLLKKNEEDYHKYMYAIQLREEAAAQIGIENIRQSRLNRIAREKQKISDDYHRGQQIYPDFRLMLLIRLEA